ncbi:AraC family transcriptional regulator [Clostridium botulinum]|uniref:Bacterial transcription activator, effector binding protein n=1 Tax=Clostridium botulinum (strain Okra / Type B1) TaxID=498213 RepID=B1IH98_CLOBK|nr:GyrI-like domain-containing protein [Clostridium botulinum]EKX79959.1 hypothetical protein CFSAN001628_009463 [Clostridium botulinum CFSAN001628]ACA45894.1 bacterial transcription activator, effector binding protein [Clostridium botulinum B1 str. Okra]MBD5561746.1 AraC family transcriptional regulator [Clostridium botulinum]MBD5565412.1 AraC family transcriptional regulator [Clostridium botulinum]MBD5570582.1 AraC family transcriptional regulator [Clostridium botulinum]
MKNLKAFYYELEGTNYEVGKLLGEKMKAMLQFVERQKIKKYTFSKEEQIQIIKMFDEYCPGINEENHKPNNQFGENVAYSEIVGIEVTSFDYIPEGMVAKVIPQGKYVVFTHKGSIHKLQETYKYIWEMWIPFSKLELDMRDDFELYDEGFKGANNHLSEIDIYIPIE